MGSDQGGFPWQPAFNSCIFSCNMMLRKRFNAIKEQT